MKRILPLLAALAPLALTPRAHAAATVTVDWSDNIGALRPEHVGLNLWDGMEHTVASQNAYKGALGQIGSPFFRYHAAEQLNPTSTRSWVTSTGAWDFAKIQTVMSNTKGYTSTRMVTISYWPAHMNAPGNPSKLDPAKYDAYADWCAQLAEWMKNNNHGVTYYEPFNEVEDGFNMTELSTIFKKCREKILAKDPNALVGGPVFRNPWNYEKISGFLAGVGNQIDFFSYHHYASGGVNGGPDSLSTLYNFPLAGDGLAGRASGLRHQLNLAGLSSIPLFVTEHNMYYTYHPDTSVRWMTSHRSAAFDALVFKSAAESGVMDGLHTWNDLDNTYGKIDRNTLDASGNYVLRAGGKFTKLTREILVGNAARVTSNNPGEVQALATYSGGRHVLALINRSDNAHTVTTSFVGGWSPSTSAYTEHRVSSAETGGYASSGRTWGGPPVVTMPANSVYLLQFSSGSRAGGRRPYGGSARSLVGRIQAEDYDHGGQGVAYHDSFYGNAGGAYRYDSVDIYTTADSGGGHSVGAWEPTEELKYTVNVPAAGAYTLNLRGASYWGVGSSTIVVKLDGTQLATLGLGQTWGDDNFTTSSASVTIPSGSVGNNRTLSISSTGGGFRLNWIEFVAPTLVNNGTYRIVNRNSGKALTVAGNDYNTQYQVYQLTYDGRNHQRWNFTRQTDGTYYINNVGSTHYMDISGASTSDGAPNIQWSFNGGANQRWIIEDAGGGYRRIKNVNSGKYLDINGASTSDNAINIQWPNNGGYNQMWTITAP